MISPQTYDGLRKFLRLQTLPLQEYQLRQNTDVFDLLSLFDSVRDAVHSTSRCVGQTIRQTSPYDLAEDVKSELEELLFFGDTPQQIARQRKLHLVVYHSVIEPLIDGLMAYDHQTVLDNIDAAIEDIKRYTIDFDDYGMADDGVVAKHQLALMVRQRAALRAAAKETSKRRKSKAPKLEEILEAD